MRILIKFRVPIKDYLLIHRGQFIVDIPEGQKRLAILKGKLQNGSITREQFSAGINQIRVQDSRGTWWQPDPSGQGWIFWDGTAWKQGILPAPTPPAPSTGAPGTISGSVDEFKAGMMDLKTFRQVSKEVPLAKRPQKWWDLLSIIGGVVAAVIWIIYSGMSPAGGGVDLLTVILMIAVPIALVWFRTSIDGLLLPVQPTRKKIPKFVLVGVGIVIPFLTAFILYNILGIANYPLIQANLIIGTLCSYVLVRDPVTNARTQPPGNRGRPALTILVVLISLLIVPVLADDCARDPTRAEDCLRTPGYAELISGTAAAGLSILVNGPIIIQTVAAGAGGGVSAGASAGAQTPPPTGYFENGQPYWGTGNSNDPFRDYPDANNPPYMPSPDGKGPIWGDGTSGNPFRDYPDLPVYDHTPTPPDAGTTPPATPPRKTLVTTPPSTSKSPPLTTPEPTSRTEPETEPETEETEPETEPKTEPETEPETEETEPELFEGETVPEKIIEGVEGVKGTLDDLNDKAGEMMDFVKDNNFHNFSPETKKKLENLQKKIKDSSDMVNDFLSGIKDNAEAVKDKIDTIKKLKKNLGEIMKNLDDLNKTIKDLPMDGRSKAMLNMIVGTADAAGRGFDEVLRNTLGDTVADAVNAKELGKDVGEAVGKTAENVTVRQRQILSDRELAVDVMGNKAFEEYEDMRKGQEEIDEYYRKKQAKADAEQKQRESYH